MAATLLKTMVLQIISAFAAQYHGNYNDRENCDPHFTFKP